MCRIAGIIDPSNSHLTQDVLAIRDAMHRGGPDSAGIFVDDHCSLALGHRRLSIIDISDAGNQPMCSEAGDAVLVFNGEIYNYLELKEELQAKGYRFSSHSDTEVILKAYEFWGHDCFGKLKGMFALALFDRKSGRLLLARDHAGIKPLYYFLDKERLYFSSEIRGLTALKNRWEEDPNWKIYFLTYGFLPGQVTTLKGVKPLEKGSVLSINTSTLEARQSFYFHEAYPEKIETAIDAKAAVRSSLEAAVQRHLIADAPLGLFLSGGIDSSLLTIIAKKYKQDLHTLSITFEDERFNEQHYQELIAKKTGSHHQSFLVTKHDFVEALPDILCAMDQPSADGINSYFISKYARQAGLKAVLSGLGADELFGGYPSFNRSRMIRRLRKLPRFVLNRAHLLPQQQYHKISFLGTQHHLGDYLFNRGYFTPLETARLMDASQVQVKRLLFSEAAFPGYAQLSEGNRVSHLETSLYMEHQLLKDADFMSMWHSVEVRVPFLDPDFMQTARNIQSELKYSHSGKFLLIDTFRDELPREIWDRKKKGFQLPFDEWMKDSLHEMISSRQGRIVNEQFDKGQLAWSRYWAFLLSQNFAVGV